MKDDTHANERNDTRPKTERDPQPVPDVAVEGSVYPEKIDIEQDLEALSVTIAQEETRAKIALHFTKMFLLLVSMCVFMPFIINLAISNTFNNPLEIAKELVTLIASVLAGPFGFIVGFYFKQTTQK